MTRQPLIVNFFGGPGAGKSTLASGLFYLCKTNNIKCDLVLEFAKEKAMENNVEAMEYQPYITGNQQYRQYYATKNFDLVITDSPNLLGILYDSERNLKIRRAYAKFITLDFLRHDNLNFFVGRNDKTWYREGRCHTLEESQKIDEQIQDLLFHLDISVEYVYASKDEAQYLYDRVLRIFNSTRDSRKSYDAKEIEKNIDKWIKKYKKTSLEQGLHKVETFLKNDKI